MLNTASHPNPTAATGITGLDEVLYGGLTPNRLYLVEGDPGSGKTTLALQFLMEGVRQGEPCLFVTLSESEVELRTSAASHGWSLDGIKIVELIAPDQTQPEARYTMFHPSEVELSETTKAVLEQAEQLKPARLVFDSLSELRLMAQNSFRYRRQILALKQFFTHQQCTVLLIDDKTTGDASDRHLHSIAHGVISLERIANDFGAQHRRLEIRKLRGAEYRAGFHDFRIRRGGLEVYPRLVASEHKAPYDRELVASGNRALDSLLGGGLARGTSTLILGPAGSGKSSVAAQYVTAAAQRGDHAVIYVFDESIATYLERSAGLGMKLERLVTDGRVSLRQIDPAELTAGEFAHVVRKAVERDRSRIVVIDSLNGYLNAMPNERYLTLHLHEMLTYLGQQGVTTLLLMAQHGLVGPVGQTPVDASYLADTVILNRYFEAAGEVRQAISVIKKRTGYHERTIRELRLEQGTGIFVGEPLREFNGVLMGTPTYVGRQPVAGEAIQ